MRLMDSPIRASSRTFMPLTFDHALAVQKFGKNSNPYDTNPKTKDPQEAAKDLTGEFIAPKPVRWFQKALLRLTQFVVLPRVKKIQVDAPPAEINKLKALPANAGNMLVASHPDMDDGLVMFHLNGAVNKMPAGFFMASEVYQMTPKILRPLWKYAGAIMVKRGKPNPEAIDYLSDKISQGGWGGIFPEGSVYWSRNVLPMEYGAVKITVEAALKAQAAAKKSGKKPQPVFLTPYAHVFLHTNLVEMNKNMGKALEELEKRPDIFGKVQEGGLVERLRKVANQILQSHAKEYGVSTEGWDKMDNYARAEALEKTLIERLEKKYHGAVQEGYVRRRALKVRMMIYDQMKQPGITPEKKAELDRDKQMSMDVVSLIMFDREYKNKFNDTETWGEFLRRIRSALDMSPDAFGTRKAVVRILPSIDMHPAAEAYSKLTGEETQKQFLFDLTEKVRLDIQAEIDKICKEHPTPPLD